MPAAVYGACLHSLALSGAAFNFDGYDGLIIKRLFSGGMLAGGFKKRIHDRFNRPFPALPHNFFHPGAAEQFASLVTRIDNDIAEEDKHISGLGPEGELVVCRVVKQSQRQASGFDDLDLALMTVDRPRQTGIGDLQSAVVIVPDSVDQRDKLPIDAALAQREVNRREHLRRA